jgi:hypothetical protein
MKLALVFSLGLLAGCEPWTAPVASPAGSIEDLRPNNSILISALIRVPFFPIPARAAAGNYLIESVAEEEEEEDSPEPGEDNGTSLAFFIPLHIPHLELLSSCRRRETAFPRQWPSPQLRC